MILINRQPQEHISNITNKPSIQSPSSQLALIHSFLSCGKPLRRPMFPTSPSPSPSDEYLSFSFLDEDESYVPPADSPILLLSLDKDNSKAITLPISVLALKSYHRQDGSHMSPQQLLSTGMHSKKQLSQSSK